MSLLTWEPVMIFVTRILKKTVGEDNAKTEMYILHPLMSLFVTFEDEC